MKFLLPLFVLAILLVGCSASAPASVQKRTGAGPQDAINVHVGEEFTIELNANPSTGFSWVVDCDKEMLEHAETKYVSASEEGMVGMGGTDEIVFKALAAGQTKITLTYMRPWESVQPADKRIFMVNIAE